MTQQPQPRHYNTIPVNRAEILADREGAEQNIANTDAALEFLPLGEPIPMDIGINGIEFPDYQIGDEFYCNEYKDRHFQITAIRPNAIVAHDLNENLGNRLEMKTPYTFAAPLEGARQIEWLVKGGVNVRRESGKGTEGTAQANMAKANGRAKAKGTRRRRG